MNLPEPLFTGASILPEEYRFLQEFCRANNIRRVLEFGPGVSTLAFLKVGCVVVSIENNKKCFLEIERALSTENCTLLLGTAPGIMNHAAIAGERFDLAFVDGPPAKGPLPRLNSVQAAMCHAPIVLLHDANRSGETRTIYEVTKHEGWRMEAYPSDRGIAILRSGGNGDGEHCNQLESYDDPLTVAPTELESLKPASIFEVIDAKFFCERDNPKHNYIQSRRYYEYYYALGRFYKPSSILEIGVRLGYSLGSLIAGSGRVSYACGIDKQCYMPGSNSKASKQISQFMPGTARVDIRSEDSQKLLALDRAFDMIHVDGDHTQAGAMHDLELCLGRCNVMLVDDYDLCPGVKGAVDRFVQKHRQKIHRWYYIETLRGLAVIDFVDSGGDLKRVSELITVGDPRH